MPEATPGNRASSEVDPLEVTGVHEDLHERSWLGEPGHGCPVELERDHAVLVVREEVGPQDGAHEPEEHPKEPVGVEAVDPVDRLLDRRDDLVLPGHAGPAPRGAEARDRRLGPIQPHREQLDEAHHHLRVGREHPRKRGVRERRPDLSQVPEEGSEQGDLAPAEPGQCHQSLQAVALGALLEHRADGGLDLRQHRGILGEALAERERQLVDEDGRGILRTDLVGVLLEDRRPEVLHHRDDSRERQRRPPDPELQPVAVLHRPHQTDVHLLLGLRPCDDPARFPGPPLDPEARGERVPELLERARRRFLAEHLGERRAERVLPPSGELRHGRLEREQLFRPGGGRPDHEMELRETALTDAHRRLNRGAERSSEERFDPLQHLGLVAFPRDVDEEGDVAAVAIGPAEEPHPLVLLEVEDRDRRLEQPVLFGLEELVPGQRVQDGDQRLLAVALRRQPHPLEHRRDLAANDGHVSCARVVREARVEPDEASLADGHAVRVQAFHPDVVELRGAVHGRPGVRLGQNEWRGLAREPVERRRKHAGAAGRRGAGQQAEAGLEPGSERRPVLLDDEVVLAVAEEDEVTLRHPPQERCGLPPLLEPATIALGARDVATGALLGRGVPPDERDAAGLGSERAALELLGQLECLGPHRLVVRHGAVHVSEHSLEVVAEPVRLALLTPAECLQVDEGLEALGSGARSGDADTDQLAIAVPLDLDDRMDDVRDPEPVALDLHRDRVDEEGHVVGHGVDGEPRGMSALHPGADPDEDLPPPTPSGQLPDRPHIASQLVRVVLEEELRRRILEEHPGEAPLERCDGSTVRPGSGGLRSWRAQPRDQLLERLCGSRARRVHRPCLP